MSTSSTSHSETKFPEAPILNEEQYAKCFKVFVSRSHEYDNMKSNLIDYLIGMKKQNIKMLSIGAGTGFFDQDVIGILSENHISVEYHAIEPNPAHLVELHKRFPDSNIMGCYYTLDTKIDNKFDVILMSHCLYPIPQSIEIVGSTINYLTESKDGFDGGKVIVFHQGSGSMVDYVKKFNEFLNPDRSVYANHTISSDDISQNLSLGSKKISHRILYGYIDMKGIWENDDDLHEMITFFIQTNTRLLPVELYQMMVTELKNKSPNDVYYHPTGMIVIG